MYYDATKNFASHGVNVENVTVDVTQMMSNKNKSVEVRTVQLQLLISRLCFFHFSFHGKRASN